MRLAQGLLGIAAVLGLACAQMAYADTQKAKLAGEVEDYEHVAMPAGFQVLINEFEGPVFADAQGRTLYRWPIKSIRNGEVGEQRNKPACDNHVYTENSGLMSPYPGGYTLPEVETRPSCAEVWPPVLATADAKPVGKFTIVKRDDGSRQWAYDGYALYTSVLDKQPGDVLGATHRKAKTDTPGVREPVSPPLAIPPQFSVSQVASGRLLTDHRAYSVYYSDKDGKNKSNCDEACLREWSPVLAPQFAQSQGEWVIFERSPGVKQWSFRGHPLYTRKADETFRSLEGSDVPGWHNAYTQKAPAPPKEFTVQDTRSGQVLADAHGKTLYVYNCADDALDQLACDNPDSTQAYRFAICGGGDPVTCNKTWPMVPAAANAKSDSRIWSTMDIDPMTGHRAAPGAPNAEHVWAYRGRPVYTFAGDHEPGDIEGDAWGEFNAWRNGFKAFWVRDDFRDNAG